MIPSLQEKLNKKKWSMKIPDLKIPAIESYPLPQPDSLGDGTEIIIEDYYWFIWWRPVAEDELKFPVPRWWTHWWFCRFNPSPQLFEFMMTCPLVFETFPGWKMKIKLLEDNSIFFCFILWYFSYFNAVVLELGMTLTFFNHTKICA